MSAATADLPLEDRVRIALGGFRTGLRIVLLSMGVLFALVLTYNMQPYRVLHNITPSLREGVGFYVYDSRQVRGLKRGDIVAFQYVAPEWINKMGWPVKDRDIHIKRVYGLPGDSIETTADGDVRVCAADKTTCSSFKRLKTDSHGQPLRWIDLPKVVPEDTYFLAGEHWFSLDSRYHGVVQAHALLGKVVGIWAKPISADELSGANGRGRGLLGVPDLKSMSDQTSGGVRTSTPAPDAAVPRPGPGDSSSLEPAFAFDVAVAS